MRSHVIISGTGRCGTTALIELLTRLGLDTGITLRDIELRGTPRRCRLALKTFEYSTRKLSPKAPYIIKSPHFCVNISKCLYKDKITVDHLFVPMRALFQAAESARQTFKGRKLVGTYSRKPGEQERVMMRRLYGLLLVASAEMIPVTLMRYPLLTENSEYLYKKLSPILKDITYETFADVFAGSMKPTKVHVYTKGAG